MRSAIFNGPRSIEVEERPDRAPTAEARSTTLKLALH